jgi:hypothetical protein
MSDLMHVGFFGDGEKQFLLTPELIVELERKTASGIGGLCRRLFAGEFRHSEMTEVIRLGLVGGGTSPKEADALVAAYAIARPISEIFPLAVAVLNALWFGNAKKDANGPA